MIFRMITPEQSRAARGLLAWSQQELANKAGVGIVTVHQLEAGTSQPRRATLDVIRRAFERPMHSLCTLPNRCRQRSRNTRYHAGAAPYVGRTSTGWIAPASLAHSLDHLYEVEH